MIPLSWSFCVILAFETVTLHILHRDTKPFFIGNMPAISCYQYSAGKRHLYSFVPFLSAFCRASTMRNITTCHAQDPDMLIGSSAGAKLVLTPATWPVKTWPCGPWYHGHGAIRVETGARIWLLTLLQTLQTTSPLVKRTLRHNLERSSHCGLAPYQWQHLFQQWICIVGWNSRSVFLDCIAGLRFSLRQVTSFDIS